MTDTTPLITGVDFVCVPAQDFDATTTFYGETLGLPFIKGYGNRPGAECQAGNLTLAITRTEDFGVAFSPNAMPIALLRARPRTQAGWLGQPSGRSSRPSRSGASLSKRWSAVHSTAPLLPV
jgi:catechol 2,3-dioxygenase-like lactoylglutathione lyase family enzyme